MAAGEEAAHLLHQARTCRELDAFFQAADSLPLVSDADLAGLASLSRSPCMGGTAALSGLFRVWYKDIRWTLLLKSILLNSAWANGLARPSIARELSLHSGLSVPAVLLAIRDAKQTGDFEVTRFSADRRVNVLEPSEAVIALSTMLRDGYLRAVKAHFHRDLDTGAAALPLERGWRRIYLDLVLNRTGFTRERSQRLVAAQRIFTLWPIVLGERISHGDFVEQVSRDNQLSAQTIRNRVQWLREAGWLEAGDRLALTALAERRFRAMARTFWRRGQHVLDLLEVLRAAPMMADAISTDTSNRRGELVTFPHGGQAAGLPQMAY